MIKSIILSLIATFCVFAISVAQNRKITGNVTDESGNSIIGATVVVENTGIGTTAGVGGDFSISAPANGSLIISYIGYETAIVPIASKTHLAVELKIEAMAMDEVIVAFGTKRQQDLVGSVSKVSNEIIANSQSASISKALEGAVAGLQVITTSGQPGGDGDIIIRGVGSLSASISALIVVDGTPFNGPLSDINSADIANIFVSKDAVSNSLYGSRAANGVVHITTKRGRSNETTITFKGGWGVSSRSYKDYDMVTDQGEFYEMAWYGIRNTRMAEGHNEVDASAYASNNLLKELGNYNSFTTPEGEDLVGSDGKLNPNAKVRYDDTFADAMFDTSFRQEYMVSASGGTDKTDFYLSVGYLDDDSYIVGSSYDRISSRANINTQLTKWLKVGTNIAYSKTTSKGVSEAVGKFSNPFIVARSWAPIFPVYARDAEGSVKIDEKGDPIYDNGLAGTTDGTDARPNGANQNIIVNLKEDIRKNTYNNMFSRNYVEISFLERFIFQANYSYDFRSGSETEYFTPTIGDGESFGGRGTKTAINSSTSNFNQILSYNESFGNHHVSAKLGHEFYSYNKNYFDGQKTNFFDPINPELANGGPMESMTSYEANHEIEGYFAMADYNYAHKYYFSAAFRRDGTSRFLERWGNFWSIGGAWRVSEENFMKNITAINDLKLRASYGTQGNENIPPPDSDPNSVYFYTPYQDQFEINWDGTNHSAVPEFYGNPELTWEKQSTLDIGIDFRIIDRIYGSIEYFNRTTDDMLFKKPLAISAGRPYNWENLGEMVNRGVEFNLNFNAIMKRDFNWTISILGSHYKNKVMRLPDINKKDGIVDGVFKLFEGKSCYEYFTYKYAGIDDEGKPTWYHERDAKDDDGNMTREVVATDDYEKATKFWLGKSALPDFTGGLHTTLSFKGLDISIATAFQIGGYAYDTDFVKGMSNSYHAGHNKEMWATYNPVTKEGKYPIWNTDETSNVYTATSDAHLVSASYLSIRNITLGYTFSQSWIRKIGIKSLRVFISADNLALWSARQGFDPRVSLSGRNSDFGGYSPMRTISGGLNLNF